MSEKTIGRFYGSCFGDSSQRVRGRQNRLIRLGGHLIAGMRLRSKYEFPTVQVMRTHEVRPRKDKRGVDLISDALPFGRLWYDEPNAVDYAMFFSRSHDAGIRVYDSAS